MTVLVQAHCDHPGCERHTAARTLLPAFGTREFAVDLLSQGWSATPGVAFCPTHRASTRHEGVSPERMEATMLAEKFAAWPRYVETVEEIDEFPTDTVLVDRDGRIFMLMEGLIRGTSAVADADARAVRPVHGDFRWSTTKTLTFPVAAVFIPQEETP